MRADHSRRLVEKVRAPLQALFTASESVETSLDCQEQTFAIQCGRLRDMRKVESPNPGWGPGSKQRHPFPSDEMIELDPAEAGTSAMYPFIISSIVPRPVAFICSLSKEVLDLLVV